MPLAEQIGVLQTALSPCSSTWVRPGGGPARVRLDVLGDHLDLLVGCYPAGQQSQLTASPSIGSL